MTKHLTRIAMALLVTSCSANLATPDAPAPPDAAAAPDTPAGPTPVALDAMATPDQLSCGSASCDTTANPHCCGGDMMMLGCTATCSSPIDLTCDGPEDCATGQLCCATPSMTGIQSVCAASCTMQQVQFCHNASQCPADAPVCCGGVGATTGACSPSGACH